MPVPLIVLRRLFPLYERKAAVSRRQRTAFNATDASFVTI
jgi:hypothetical protein